MIMENKYNSIVHSLTKGKSDNTFIQLIRYTFIGGLAFIIDFGTLFILTEYLDIHYLISAGIAFILGLTFNYFFSTKWVFSKRSFKNRNLEFLLFAFIGIAGLGLNELFMWIFTELLLIYYLGSKIITTIIVYVWNFFARKFLLFN
jgi:putative flippase GtrA